MLRVVLDTVVFVRSLINPHGSAGRIVFSINRYRLFLSRPVITEILAVLARPELTAKFRSLERMDVRAVIEILGRAEVVEIGEIAPISRDPKDDIFLATSAAAAAHYLVSEDRDLLVLEEYSGTMIVDTAGFLRVLDEGL